MLAAALLWPAVSADGAFEGKRVLDVGRRGAASGHVVDVANWRLAIQVSRSGVRLWWTRISG